MGFLNGLYLAEVLPTVRGFCAKLCGMSALQISTSTHNLTSKACANREDLPFVLSTAQVELDVLNIYFPEPSMIKADGVKTRLAAFGNLFRPSFFVAHHRVESFAAITLPLSKSLHHADGSPADIRAIVLDKDDCFARPLENDIYEPFKSKFRELREAYPGSRLLIVSNSAGSQEYDDTDDLKVRRASIHLQ
jgi:hypothetical protein